MCYYCEEPYETLKERVSKREQNVLKAIIKYIEKNGYGPTMRDIVNLTDISSTSTAYKYAKKLKEKGFITWQEKRAGTLTLLHIPIKKG